MLIFVLCTGVHANLFMELIDPSISLWDPIQADASSLSVAKLGFSNNTLGYVAAFGDFNSDK